MTSMTLLFTLVVAGNLGAEPALRLHAGTFNADENCRWTPAEEVRLPGNAWFIGGPPSLEARGPWRAALAEYRREVREDPHRLGRGEITFGGARGFTRMQDGVARAIDIRPGEPLRIEMEALRREGDGELIVGFDLMDRAGGGVRSWSGALSRLEVPGEGSWRRLEWEGPAPAFDAATGWARLAFGMQAAGGEGAPATISVRSFALFLPARGEGSVQTLALDRSIYDRQDLRWASRAFICHFTFLYEESLYSSQAGRLDLSDLLEEGRREFGGYDAVVLWHAYPRIGVDERNQFDFYRDMPGGLAGLRELTGGLHERGIRVFIDYNPWDTGTRREGVPDEGAIAVVVAALDADGVFLDTMSAGSPRLRQAVDRARKGVIFEPEGSPPIDQLEVCSASWAQGLAELPEPGILRLKWIEPRHPQHQIDRWSGSHRSEIETAFLNGSGVLVWENVFGAWNPWVAEDRAVLRRMAPILRLFAENFSSDAWEPFVPTLVPGVYACAWPGREATVWTILNRTGREVREPILRVTLEPGESLFDLWRGEPIDCRQDGGPVDIRVPLGPSGCVAAARDGGLEKTLEAWAAARRAEARPASSAGDSHVLARDVSEPRPVAPSPRAPIAGAPPGMVLVPAGTVTMNLRHPRRECGCYPDPGTPEAAWRRNLWGTPFNETLEHRMGPVPLPDFFIDDHEVTNAEYARFLEESGYRPAHAENFLKHWGGSRPPEALRDHPVVHVDLDDARAYARWARKRLPTEAEWQRAAQGDDRRAWPWGNEFDPARVNGDGPGTRPVKSYPEGRSPFGAFDMAGNVWEWTESERSDGHTRFSMIRGGSYFKARGSAWYVEGGAQPNSSHAKFIHLWPGLDRCSTIGFRCVKDAAAAEPGPPAGGRS
jgi:formylglycine-generating enzyme required for sulfatase activity